MGYLKYYSWANRYRGSKSKAVGYLLLMLPTLLVVSTVLLFYGLLWIFAFTVVYLLHTLIEFKWGWGSHYWPSLGKKGDRKALARLWRFKSVLAFGLLFQPWLGWKMSKAADIYFKCLNPEMPDSIERAEKEIGALYGKLIIIATICLSIGFIAYLVLK